MAVRKEIDQVHIGVNAQFLAQGFAAIGTYAFQVFNGSVKDILHDKAKILKPLKLQRHGVFLKLLMLSSAYFVLCSSNSPGFHV